MTKLLVATWNKGKLIEYQQLLKGLPFDFVNLQQENIHNEVAEKFATYEENALHKARYYADKSGLLTLADDSGLEIDALNGEPGVKSARYAGKKATDRQRIDLVLARMAGIAWEKRVACFKCVIAICFLQGKSGIFYGECRGYITFKPKGEYGFGYDPIFYIPGEDKTMAELTPDKKNHISHRARAAQAAYNMLKELVDRTT